MNTKSTIKGVLITMILLISTTISKAQLSKIELGATGLTCSMCSNAIFKQLKSISEVDSITTDLNTNTFVATLKKGNTLDPSVFKRKVEKAGFFIGSLTVTAAPELLSQGVYIILEGKALAQTEIKFQVLDKGYVTEKEFKKLAKVYKERASFSVQNESDFHVKIVNQ